MALVPLQEDLASASPTREHLTPKVHVHRFSEMAIATYGSRSGAYA
jgi:hypothetical protein